MLSKIICSLFIGAVEIATLHPATHQSAVCIADDCVGSTFKKELARCQLSMLCGDAPGIDGVLDWQAKYESRLDNEAVESAHPHLVDEYREKQIVITTQTGAAGEIAGET